MKSQIKETIGATLVFLGIIMVAVDTTNANIDSTFWFITTKIIGLAMVVIGGKMSKFFKGITA